MFDEYDSSVMQIGLDRKAEAKRLQQRADLATVLKTFAGRRVIWLLLQHGRIFDPSFSPDACEMAYNEGRKSAGLLLLKEIEEIEPGILGALMKEARS